MQPTSPTLGCIVENCRHVCLCIIKSLELCSHAMISCHTYVLFKSLKRYQGAAVAGTHLNEARVWFHSMVVKVNNLSIAISHCIDGFIMYHCQCKYRLIERYQIHDA